MEKENHIRDGNFQTGYAQKRDNVIFLQCKFCNKMISKVEFAEHVMTIHLGNERVINERLNEIVENQRIKESDSVICLTEHNIKPPHDTVIKSDGFESQLDAGNPDLPYMLQDNMVNVTDMIEISMESGIFDSAISLKDQNIKISQDSLKDQNSTIGLPSINEEIFKGKLILDETVKNSFLNPWQVDSVESFSYLKCPECLFDTKEKTCFQNHAIENHPLSHVLFGKKGNNLVILDFDPNGFDSKLNENSNKAQFLTNLMETSKLDELPTKIKSLDEQIIEEPRNSNFDENILVETTTEMESKFKQQICIPNDFEKDKSRNQSLHLGSFRNDFSEITPKQNEYNLSRNAQDIFKKSLDISNEVDLENQSDEFGKNGKKLEKKCKTFHAAFSSEHSLKLHMESCNLDHLDTSGNIVVLEGKRLVFELKENSEKTHSKNVHEVKKPYKCEVCNISFAYKQGMKTHIEAVHEGIKFFNCKFCKLKTKSKADLETHMLSIHDGKKPECHICNITFWKEDHLNRHMKNVHNEKPSYSCHICGYKTIDKDYMRKHIAMVHEGKKPFKCQICDKSFGMNSGLKKHIGTVHGAPIEERKSWPCEICKKSFTSRSVLNLHISGVHEEKKFSCDICNASFSHKHHVKSHNEAIHEGIKNFACNICNHEFYQKSDFVKHFDKYHEGEEPAPIPIGKKEKSVSTINEAKSYSNLPILNPIENDSNTIEMDINMIPPIMNQPECALTTSDRNVTILDPLEYDQSSSELQFKSKSPIFFQYSPTKSIQISIVGEKNSEIHQTCKIENEKIEIKFDENSLYETTKDDKFDVESFNDVNNEKESNFKMQSVSDHEGDTNKVTLGTVDQNVNNVKKVVSSSRKKLSKKLKKKRVKCEFCEDKILSHSDLENHMLSIHDGKKPECTICNITFLKQISLVGHMKSVHNTKLTYSCHICNAKISDKDYVKKHIETVHEGKKPFKCDVCVCTFRYPSALKVHMKNSHGSTLEERKLWPCEMCKKTFTRGALKTHIAGLHEERKYRCDICNVSFAYKHNLKSHNEAIHEGIKNYACNMCNHEFYQKGDLVKHFEKYHEGEESAPISISKNERDQIDLNEETITCDTLDLKKDPLKLKKHQLDLKKDPSVYNDQLNQKKDQSKKFDTMTEQLNQKQWNHELSNGKISSEVDIKSDSIHGIYERKKPWPCTMCDKSFILKGNLMAHIDTQHDGVNLLGLIKQCLENEININEGIPDPTLRAMKKQVSVVHEENNPSQPIAKKQIKSVHEEKKLFKCGICKFSSELSIELKRHMLSNHEGLRPFSCAICDECFEQKIKLQKHIELAHGKKVPFDSL